MTLPDPMLPDPKLPDPKLPDPKLPDPKPPGRLRGEGLTLIVSQPRAGSTLLQTTLGNHPDVLDVGETWWLLPTLGGIDAHLRNWRPVYDANLATLAIDDFAARHLGGAAALRELRLDQIQQVYDHARTGVGATILLDKTPRYYHLVDEILTEFPAAKIILLVRNPVAVMSSILRTWVKDWWASLGGYREDLFTAPLRIADAITYEHPSIHAVRYESLVDAPEQTLAKIQEFVGLRPVEGLARYGDAKRRKFGDPDGIATRKTVAADSRDRYLSVAAGCPRHWRCLDDYCRLLGDDLLSRLGYDASEIERSLRSVRPDGVESVPSLDDHLHPPVPDPSASNARRLRGDADATDQPESTAVTTRRPRHKRVKRARALFRRIFEPLVSRAA